MLDLIRRIKAAMSQRPAIRPSEDLRLIAHTYGILYAAGAVIALVSLALPHDPDRSAAGALMVIAWALATGVAFLARGERVPRLLLAANPLISASMVSLFIYWTGGETAGAYAMYLFWVVGPASYFFSFGAAALSVGISCVGIAVAMERANTPMAETFLFMAVATLLVAAALLAVLRRQVDALVTHLHELSRTDDLTGLANRRAFDQRLGEELERALRAGGRPVGLVMLDLDNFKRVNDSLGHPAGDECLKAMAGILAAESRVGDLVARIGGEEFAVLLPEVDADEAAQLARRIVELVAAELGGEPYALTASAGVAAFPSDATIAARLVGSADAALYEAKRQGRDRAVAYAEVPDSSPARSTK